eukprot:1142609-Pelagomonas_calceolata.AAC.8
MHTPGARAQQWLRMSSTSDLVVQATTSLGQSCSQLEARSESLFLCTHSGGALRKHVRHACMCFFAAYGGPHKEHCAKQNKTKQNKSYIDSENTPHVNQGKGATLVQRPYDHPTTKFRLREVRQAEKEDRSNDEKESRMIAERLVFETLTTSRVGTVSLPTEESHTQQLTAMHN